MIIQHSSTDPPKEISTFLEGCREFFLCYLIDLRMVRRPDTCASDTPTKPVKPAKPAKPAKPQHLQARHSQQVPSGAAPVPVASPATVVPASAISPITVPASAISPTAVSGPSVRVTDASPVVVSLSVSSDAEQPVVTVVPLVQPSGEPTAHPTSEPSGEPTVFYHTSVGSPLSVEILPSAEPLLDSTISVAQPELSHVSIDSSQHTLSPRTASQTSTPSGDTLPKEETSSSPPCKPPKPVLLKPAPSGPRNKSEGRVERKPPELPPKPGRNPPPKPPKPQSMPCSNTVKPMKPAKPAQLEFYNRRKRVLNSPSSDSAVSSYEE